MEDFQVPNEFSNPVFVKSTLASRGDRFLAKLIDSGIIIGIGLVSVLTGALADKNGIAMVVLLGTGLLCLLFYQAYLLTSFGQTIGKRIMKIKIVKSDTEENGGFVTNFLVRGVVNAAIANIVPLYGLIDTLMIFSSDYRCIHDRLAGTKVTKV